MSHKRQIFHSHDDTRWMRTKWAFRSILFLLVIASVIVGLSIYFTGRNLPGVPLEGTAIKKVLTDTTPKMERRAGFWSKKASRSI
jgi:hypothetical protein